MSGDVVQLGDMVIVCGAQFLEEATADGDEIRIYLDEAWLDLRDARPGVGGFGPRTVVQAGRGD